MECWHPGLHVCECVCVCVCVCVRACVDTHTHTHTHTHTPSAICSINLIFILGSRKTLKDSFCSSWPDLAGACMQKAGVVLGHHSQDFQQFAP